MIHSFITNSCCKSGSCISNYLLELGTYSINTSGCSRRMNNIIRISMCVHLAVFMLVVIVEVMILRLIMKKQCNTEHSGKRKGDYNVRHIMGVKDNFHASSESYVIHPEDSDVSSRQYHDEVPQICPSSP
uniref:Uncharacterized protein n=1 Tax=Pectinophora gossypiella TaxID=13191 RepID=A0A1E1WQ47_PECGO